MSRRAQILASFCILLIGVAGAGLMIKLRPRAARENKVTAPPLVRVLTVKLEDLRLNVASQGTVTPSVTTRLVPEVSGRIVGISPSFEIGGTFEKGERLLRLEDRDYKLGLKSAEAELANARLKLAEEEAQAEVAEREWQELGRGEAEPLVLRVPQLAQARATVAAAEARVAQAELNLERTRLTAPFAGRVRDKQADIGQYVAAGSPIATLIGISHAEVRLPLPDREFSFIDLDLGLGAKRRSAASAPNVLLRAEVAGIEHQWNAKIVRTEAELDERTRMLHVVARVEDPYGRIKETAAPLAAGRFVVAEIEGRLARQVVRLPRSALRSGDQLLIVDSDDRLRFRQVHVLRSTTNEVIIDEGLQEAERVCLSTLDVMVEGMQVRVTKLASTPHVDGLKR